MARGRVPDFFVVGHPKSGTTALYEMLRRHPQVYMPEEKEPWYFSPELRHRPPPRKPFAIPETYEQYLALFDAARPEQRVGEASTTYLWSRAAAGLIAEAQPAARIVAVLREPVSFLHSLHLQFLEAYIETESDFRRALALEQARSEGRHVARYSYWPQLLQYAEHVRYVEQLRRYHDVFPGEQVLVLVYDDFRADNEAAVRAVLNFLEVDDTEPIELAEANPTVRARSQQLHQLVHAVSVGRGPVSRAAKSTVQTLTPRQLRRDALRAVRHRIVYDEPRPVEEGVARELRRRFRGRSRRSASTWSAICSRSGATGMSADPAGARWPDFFVVGQPKSGTTALYEMLRRHPQVYMPELKEPWFFASELREGAPPARGRATRARARTPRTPEEYLALFEPARPEQRTGEASVMYLWSRTAASAIAAVQPAARIVAVLREPASLVRSLHLQFVQTHVETEGDLRKALALEDARRRGSRVPRNTPWPQALQYSEHVRYVEQLRRYHAVFGPEQVKVLVYDDVRADNEGAVRAVWRFLGVDDDAPVTPTEANPTVHVRNPSVHGFVHAVSVGRTPAARAAKATVKALTPRTVRRGALRATRRHTVRADPLAPDEQLTGELRRRFKGEVVAASEYLGRDLVSEWGYDKVA